MTDVYLVRGNRYGFFGNFGHQLVSDLVSYRFGDIPLPLSGIVPLNYFSGDDPTPPMLTDIAEINTGMGFLLRRSTTACLRSLLTLDAALFPTNDWLGEQFDLVIATAVLASFGDERLLYEEEEDSPVILRYAFKPDVVQDRVLFRDRSRPGILFATNHLIDAIDRNLLVGLDRTLVWSSARDAFDTPREDFVFIDPMTNGKSMATNAREAMQAILDRRPKVWIRSG